MAESLAAAPRHGAAARLDLGRAGTGPGRLAQFLAVTEPLVDRPADGGAADLSLGPRRCWPRLISVLNARTPGERVWAGLMFLLVVVFLIPWLEEAGRMRRAPGLDARSSRFALDASFTGCWSSWA